jgi:hypothetical protein
MPDPADQVATAYISLTFLSAILAAKGVDTMPLLIILIIIAVTVVVFGFIYAKEEK